VDALLRSYANDVRFVFPGNNSSASGFRRKEAVASWLRRFHDAGLKIHPHEIVVGGPPWNTSVCIGITDWATGADGDVIYENRAVLFGKIQWGKITFYEVYEDTEKVQRRLQPWTLIWQTASSAGRLERSPGYKRTARLAVDTCGMKVLCGGGEEPNHDLANLD